MPKTTENLQTAFAGESQANRTYLAFAKAAEQKGESGIAKLFKVAAAGETVHALSHLEALGDVKDTQENLRSAIAGETYEAESMYPEFIEVAKKERASEGLASFTRARKIEEIHRQMFQDALVKSETGESVADHDYYVCGVCGFPAEGTAPDHCPVCGSPKEAFSLVV